MILNMFRASLCPSSGGQLYTVFTVSGIVTICMLPYSAPIKSVMRIRWLVRAVESKAYLREYKVVGVRWCMYSCKCTWIYIGKMNTLNKIMSLQWSNNWEPNIFNEQHNTPSCLYWHTQRFGVQDLHCLCLCYLHCLPTANARVWFIPLL
jgi:hypothetical protein